MKDNKKNGIFIILLSMVIVAILLLFEFFIQTRGNEKKANQTAVVLLNQMEDIISNNEKNENSLILQVKDDYITRAKAVSYMIDKNPEAEKDIGELIKIAHLISVDEIHLFDRTGTIYSGTNPQYYGYDFDSGEQLKFFKPMLKDKTKTMCQDMTPNTAEGKNMMYAICWNETKEHMVQIGIEPRHLMEELKSNEISEVVSNMPSYNGTQIIVADKKSQQIIGATVSSLNNQQLKSIGIDADHCNSNHICKFRAKIQGEMSYCSAQSYKDYIVVIVQNVKMVNHDVFRTLMIVFVYLFAASVLICVIIQRMTTNILQEQINANTDKMTGFFNRRAYENDLIEGKDTTVQKNFVYVSMDLNGLKTVNDSLGHNAGDALIRGAADCMQQCFGAYGRLYRFGGDEFAAMIYADAVQLEQIKQDFEETISAWSDPVIHELSVSCGYVTRTEYPDKTIEEMAAIADERMYQEKENYYKNKGIDRREQRAAFSKNNDRNSKG